MKKIKRIYMTDENPEKGRFKVLSVQFKDIDGEYSPEIPMRLQKNTPVGLVDVVWNLTECTWRGVKCGVKSDIERFILDDVFKGKKIGSTPIKEVAAVKVKYLETERVVWI